MPQHDLPDGKEAESNLIDFRQHLRRRAGLRAPDNDDPETGTSDWDVYSRAEYGDGKRAGFSRYDAMWLGLILALGWMLWFLVLR